MVLTGVEDCRIQPAIASSAITITRQPLLLILPRCPRKLMALGTVPRRISHRAAVGVAGSARRLPMVDDLDGHRDGRRARGWRPRRAAGSLRGRASGRE